MFPKEMLCNGRCVMQHFPPKDVASPKMTTISSVSAPGTAWKEFTCIK